MHPRPAPVPTDPRRPRRRCRRRRPARDRDRRRRRRPTVDPLRRVTNPVTPGDFTGYGFDRCDAQSGDHGPLAAEARRSSPSGSTPPAPRAPAQFQPERHRGLGEHPGCLGLADPADHPRPAGVSASRASPVRRRPTIIPQARRPGAATARRKQGSAEAAAERRRRRRRSASSRAARSGTTSRASTSATPGAASRRWRSSAAGPGGSTGSATSRCLLERRLGHQDARRRPPQRALRHQAARPDLDRALGRPRQHRDRGAVPARRRLAAARPGPNRYQGGHDERWGGVTINIDRDYLDVGRGRWPPETHCDGVHISFGTYPTIVPGTGEDAPPVRRVKVRSASCTSRGSTPAASTASGNTATQSAAQAFQTKRGSPSPRPGPSAAGCRCSSPATGRS